MSLPPSADSTTRLQSGASLETAQSWHIAYIDHARYANALRTTKAGACFVSERFAHIVPAGTIPIIVRDPRLVYARVLARLHPEALRAAPFFAAPMPPRDVLCIHQRRLEPASCSIPALSSESGCSSAPAPR
ncbi:LpxD N-terminal domain-containing protein [Mesorhizobium caraganae]|uniref:LpxD N-terminal domain-containing protein n=1 Tax=Mesorhizobium caraganae TaxID=483206 RepID=UPI0033382D63